MQCPECGFQLSGGEEVCPRCLTPLEPQEEQEATQPPGGSAPAVDLSAIQREIDRGKEPKPTEMTSEMRRLMAGPVWTTRRTQIALTLFLLVVAIVVLVVAFMSVTRRNADYYVEQAREHYQAGQYELAIVSNLRALEIDPDLAEAENAIGWSYLRTERPSLAIPHLNSAVSLDPNLVAAHRGLGLAYSQARMNVEAEASLKSALQIAEKDRESLRYLGKVYYQEERYEEAIEVLEEVVGARPDDREALEYLGRSLYAVGRYDEALNPLQAALDLDPSAEGVREYLGLVWHELGRYDKALEHLEFLRAAHPDDPTWYAYIGRSLYKQGDAEEAAAHLTHALTLARADTVVGGSYRTLGWIRYTETRYDEGVVLFQRALILNPLDAEAMAGLGLSYVELGRCDDAVPLFEEALGIDKYLEPARQGLEACR